MVIDRTEASRALAKAIAHKAAGNDDEAAVWAARLVELLECSSILHRDVVRRAQDAGTLFG